MHSAPEAFSFNSTQCHSCEQRRWRRMPKRAICAALRRCASVLYLANACFPRFSDIRGFNFISTFCFVSADVRQRSVPRLPGDRERDGDASRSRVVQLAAQSARQVPRSRGRHSSGCDRADCCLAAGNGRAAGEPVGRVQARASQPARRSHRAHCRSRGAALRVIALSADSLLLYSCRWLRSRARWVTSKARARSPSAASSTRCPCSRSGWRCVRSTGIAAPSSVWT